MCSGASPTVGRRAAACWLFALLGVGWLSAPVLAQRPAFQGVVVAQERATGVGGMLIYEWNPYLTFSDGSIVSADGLAPEDFDVERSRAREPRRWGRYRVDGEVMAVQWSSGYRETFDTWWHAKPAHPGEQLEGRYQFLGGGGNTSFGGTAMAVSSSEFSFSRDGMFASDGFGGGSNEFMGNRSTFGASARAGGRYRLDKFSIVFEYEGGRTARQLFYRIPEGSEMIGIGARTMRKLERSP